MPGPPAPEGANLPRRENRLKSVHELISFCLLRSLLTHKCALKNRVRSFGMTWWRYILEMNDRSQQPVPAKRITEVNLYSEDIL